MDSRRPLISARRLRANIVPGLVGALTYLGIAASWGCGAGATLGGHGDGSAWDAAPSEAQVEGESALLRQHIRAVNTLDPGVREQLMKRAYSYDVKLVHPSFAVQGRDAVFDVYAAFHRTAPEYELRIDGAPSFSRGSVRVRWTLCRGDVIAARGEELLLVEAATIQRIYVFVDPDTDALGPTSTCR